MELVASSALRPAFPAWSITLPPPLPFPRELFAGALEEHGRLLARHSASFSFLVRQLRAAERDLPPSIANLGAVVVARQGKADEVRVLLRGEVAHYAAEYRGVLRHLLLRDQRSRMPVVVFGRGAVSLHLGAFDMGPDGAGPLREFAVDTDEVVVEPILQEHRTDGPYVVTRWVHPDGENRYAWAPVPPEPRTYEEAADRILARYEPLVRPLLRSQLSAGASRERFVVTLSSGPRTGDGVKVGDNPALFLGGILPRIVAAIERYREREYVPVLVSMGRCACLRWIEVDGEAGSERPEPITEALFPVRAARSAEKGVHEQATRTSRSAAEAWVALMQMARFDAVDRYLAGKSEEEIDREIGRPKREKTHE